MAKQTVRYRARTTFFPPSKLSPAPIVEDKMYDGDNPVVKKYPESFEKVRVTTAGEAAPVERATAAPGEKRAVAKPATTKAKAKGPESGE